MSKKYTKPEKVALKNYKQKQDFAKKSSNMAYNATYDIVKFGEPIISIIVATIICGIIAYAIPNTISGWAEDASNYTVMMWTLIAAVICVWGGYVFFSVKKLIKNIKEGGK